MIDHLARIKRLIGKTLIEDNGYSGEYAPAFSTRLHPCSVLVKINNDVYIPFKLVFQELISKLITSQNE